MGQLQLIDHNQPRGLFAMAGLNIGGKRKAPYICKDCDKEFNYLSKYQRHLEAATHRRFASLIVISGEEVSETIPELDFEPVGLVGDNDLCSEIDNEVQVESIENEGEIPDYEVSEEEGESEDELTDEDLGQLLANLSSNDDESDCFPFKSHKQALAFMLVNGPRPMGEENLRFIFYILGISLSEVKNLKLPGFREPAKHYTSGGIPFYTIYPSRIIEKCMGMPSIATSIARFPVQPANELREMCHGRRWMEDQRFFSPMISIAIGQVFVNDFIKVCSNNNLKTAKVDRFFRKEGFSSIFIKVVLLCQEVDDICVIEEEAVVSEQDVVSILPIPSFIYKQDTCSSSLIPLSQIEYDSFTAPHRLKAIAAGKPVVMVPLILYTDDTSGNKSKVWNKFDLWCLKLAGLSKKDNSKLQNIHFITCSNKCGVLDMSKPMVDDLVNLECNGMIVYDASLCQEVLVVAPVMCAICDNPRSSEIMSHSVPLLTCFAECADKTKIGSTISILRSKEHTMKCIEIINKKKTEKEKSEYKTKFGINTNLNPLLLLPVDFHKSTPVETLHTILLGPYKYLLRRFIPQLSEMKKRELRAMIAAFNFSGIRYRLDKVKLLKHFKSFVGRNFKSVAQCGIFIFRYFLSPGEKQVWISLSKVFKLAYCDYCLADEESQSQYKKTCKNFVDMVIKHVPELAKKLKVHLILHFTDNMLDFGPTSAFNTERCEAFNSLLRARNIFANRLAPSRDIARGFEMLESLRSVCDGNNHNSSRSVGSSLKQLYVSPPVQSYLNGASAKELLSEKRIYMHGALRKLIGRQNFGDVSIFTGDHGKLTLNELKEKCDITLLSSVPPTAQVDVYGAVMSNNCSLINSGDYVHFNDGEMSVVDDSIGLLLASVCNVTDKSSLCLIRLLQYVDDLGTRKFNELDCPLLTLTDLIYLVPSAFILNVVSVIHECTDSCTFHTSSVSRTVEHEHVTTQELTYTHDYSIRQYCHNIYCMNL